MKKLWYIDGGSRKAAEWLDKTGRVYALKNAKITKENYEILRVAIVKEKGMKDTWVLAKANDVKFQVWRRCCHKGN